MTMATADQRDPEERNAEEFVRRRRGRNYALLAVLVALVLLFYAITIVQRAGIQ